MSKILAPHKEQERYVYVRMWKEGSYTLTSSRHLVEDGRVPVMSTVFGYSDDQPDQRVIASKRVEEAVETYDYLKKCEDEGLWCDRCPVVGEVQWSVWRDVETKLTTMRWGATLREAYHRYHAAV
jgi:hypothetical protein